MSSAIRRHQLPAKFHCSYSGSNDDDSLRASYHIDQLSAAMPKLTKGCYSKCGYPDDMHVQGYTLHFLASGCTRQVYDIEQLPDAVAKVMPSRRSIHWKEGYEQNEVEFEALSKLQSLEGAPKIFVYEESAAFINVCGQIDFANLLVVSKLGQDLQAAAGQINLREYITAYEAALWALRHMLELGVVVPDPHPYNLAMERDGGRALPCDFGSTEVVSEKRTHSLLKKFFNGFNLELRRCYGVVPIASASFGYAQSHCSSTIDGGSMDLMLAHMENALTAPSYDPWFAQPHASAPPPRPRTSQGPPTDPRSGNTTQPITAGSFAMIKDLVARPDLNGVGGIVQACLFRGRVQVKTELKTVVSVRAINLEVIARPSRAWICRQCKINAYWSHNPEDNWTGGKGKWRCPECSPVQAETTYASWSASGGSYSMPGASATWNSSNSWSSTTTNGPPPSAPPSGAPTPPSRAPTPPSRAPPLTATREIKMAALGLAPNSVKL